MLSLRLASLLQQRAGDDHHLNFAGALIDLSDLGITHHTLDGVITGVAVTAEQLQAAAGHVAGGTGGDQLRLGSLDAVADLGAVHGLLLFQASLINQILGSVNAGFHLSQLELGVLELGDGAAELLTLFDVGNGLVDGALGNAQSLGSDADTAAVQRSHGQLEALALDAEQTILRDDAVFHDQLAGGGTTDAHLVLGLADLEAGIGALYDEGADLLLLAAALVGDKTGNSDDDEHIGKAGVGDEDLGAVQLPVVALIHGKGLLTLGVGAGTDAQGQQTFAVDEGDHWKLNGSKIFITNAGFADVFIIIAVTGFVTDKRGRKQKEISAFIVERTDPGFKVGKPEDKMGIRGSSTCELIMEDCIIPKDRLLGVKGKGFQLAMATLDGGRIGIAAQALGIAEGAIDETVAYVKERKQFGRSIAQFQNTQFELAEMKARVDAAKYLVYKAGLKKQQAMNGAKVRYSVEAAEAKLIAARTASDVTRRCLQLFGGYGYTRDYPIERMMRDAKITEIYEGTSEVQMMVISGALLK